MDYDAIESLRAHLQTVMGPPPTTHGLSSDTMALITSDYGTMRSPRTKRP